MRVSVMVLIASADIYAVVLFLGFREDTLVRGDHVRPDLINIKAVSKVHHIRCVAAGRSHIDFESHEVTLLSDTFFVCFQTEELQVDKSSVRVESTNSCAACFFQTFIDVPCYIVDKLKLVVDDICD